MTVITIKPSRTQPYPFDNSLVHHFLREEWDAHDQWGSTLMAMAALHDAIGEFEYASGMAADLIALVQMGRVTEQDLHDAYNLLDAYADVIPESMRY